MATISVDKATHAELLAFATAEQNLDVPATATKAEIIDVLRKSGFTGKSFELDTSVLRPGSAAAPRAAAGGAYTHVRMTLAANDAIGGREPVYVAVNGRGIYIPRNEPVVVKRKYFEALTNAVEVYYPETGDLVVGQAALDAPIETPRFSITLHETIVGEPEPAEVDA